MSNLLEKASIITTPTAYSDGKLHSVKPKEVLGSELVTNGDFSNGSTGWSSYGTVDISNGIATIGASSNSGIFQGVLTQSKLYKVTLDVLSYNSVGNVQIINDAGFVLYSITQTGTHTFYFKHSISNANIIFRGISNALFSIDNISIKEATNADFDFQRGSAATRVNSQGLIENVQTLSGNLVQNGDFSEIGSELVTNGDFEDGGTGWSNSSINGFSVSNGKLNLLDVAYVQSTLQTNVTTVGKLYKVTYEVSNYVQGNFRLGLGGTLLPTTTSNGVYTYYVTATDSTYVFIQAFSGLPTTLSIDNVSVKEVGQNWALGTGWSIGENKANFDSVGQVSNSLLQQSLGINIGGISNIDFTEGENTYYWSNGSSSFKLTFTFTRTSGTDRIRVISSGTNLYFSALNGDNLVGSVTNISVIEITDDTDLPRIDYTDGCGSLLLEPQSTNLIPYSEDFSQWTNGITYTTQNYSVSPDGTQNASRCLFTNQDQGMFISTFLSVGSQCTASVYIKGIENETILISSGGVDGIHTLNGNWQRIQTNGTSINNTIFIGSYGGVTARDFEIWGAQLEQGSYATSYIPTNGSTVTRLADVCNNSGSSDLINSTEGVLYAEVEALANDGTYKLLEINNGGSTNRVYIAYLSNSVYVSVIVGGVPQFAESTSINSVTEFNKIAVKYKENDFALWINGIEVASDTNGVTSSIGVLNSIDFSNSSNGIPFYGNVKSLVVFKEALTNDELEGLTGEGYDTFNALALANNYTII